MEYCTISMDRKPPGSDLFQLMQLDHECFSFTSFGLWSECLAIWVAQWLVFRLCCAPCTFSTRVFHLIFVMLGDYIECGFRLHLAFFRRDDNVWWVVHPISSTLSIRGHRYSIMMYCTTRNNGIATVIRHTLIFY